MTKNTWNGKVQMHIHTNNSEEFEGTTNENVGFQGKRGQQVHLNFATNSAMEFLCHTFCAPVARHSFLGVFGLRGLQAALPGRRSFTYNVRDDWEGEGKGWARRGGSV